MSVPNPIHNRVYLFSAPAVALLSLLERPSLLALRQTSRTAQIWVDGHCPSLLTSISVTCPLPDIAVDSSSALCRLAPNCCELTVRLLPSENPIPTGGFLNPTPAEKLFRTIHSFSKLRIRPPRRWSIYPLLSLRLALESSPLHCLDNIEIEPVTFPTLLALRWGGFDSFAEPTWASGIFWRGLKRLSLGLTTDWLGRPSESHSLDQELKESRRQKRENYRMGIQALHNFLFHFALNGELNFLRFKWVNLNYGEIGPNPFLLDILASEEGTSTWFSAPAIEWKGLRDVELGAIRLGTEDLDIMKERMSGLRKVMVWAETADADLNGRSCIVDGEEWLVIDLVEDARDLVASAQTNGHHDGSEPWADIDMEQHSDDDSVETPLLLNM